MEKELSLVVRECALRLGASVPDAAAFAEGGLLLVEDTPIGISGSRQRDMPGSVMATALIERPGPLDVDLWHSMLLQVSARTMAVASMGFHLEGDHCMLVARIAPDRLQDPRLLADELRGMSAVCRSVRAGAEPVPGSAVPA